MYDHLPVSRVGVGDMMVERSGTKAMVQNRLCFDPEIAVLTMSVWIIKP